MFKYHLKPERILVWRLERRTSTRGILQQMYKTWIKFFTYEIHKSRLTVNITNLSRVIALHRVKHRHNRQYELESSSNNNNNYSIILFCLIATRMCLMYAKKISQKFEDSSVASANTTLFYVGKLSFIPLHFFRVFQRFLFCWLLFASLSIIGVCRWNYVS